MVTVHFGHSVISVSHNNSFFNNIFTRELETSNPNYSQKLKELKDSGGTLAATENLVRLVTNKNRFPEAPNFLPQYILLRNMRILTLKKKENVVNYSNNENLTNLILVEPWRSPDDLDWIERDLELFEDVMRRKRLILPLSSPMYPE